MNDVIDEGEKLLQMRINSGEGLLNVDDVKHLIYYVMKDANVDDDELYDLRRIDKFKDKYMTPNAQRLFGRIVGIFKGEIQPKPKDNDLYSIAKEMLKSKKMGRDSKLDLNDIKELIYLVIEDGRMSRWELEEMKKVERYKYNNMTEDAVKAFEEFLDGFNTKVINFERQQMRNYRAKHQDIDNDEYNRHINKNIRGDYIRKVHDMAPETYRQCGNCYGSGRITCYSCNGMGGTYSSRVDYDYDGTPIYRDEFIPCSCSGGYQICGSCGGSGSVYR